MKKSESEIDSAFRILNSAFSSSRRGFSLVELIVVMLVIGILTVLVMEKFTGMSSTRTRMAGNELRSHLRYIHNLAMDRERAMRVRFNVVSNSYDVYVAVTNWTGVYLPAKDPASQNDWIVAVGDRFAGVALASVNINAGDTLYFSATNGIPFDVSLALLTNGTIVFQSGLTVTITPDTGYVRLE